MKKIINGADNFVHEVLEGILLAHPDALRAVTADSRALVRIDAGAPGRVGIVTGGGSGHLPLFLGYVGMGLASGVGVGNVFSSPSAERLHAATVASDGGAGVLYLYGNYGGDVYNFDTAAELSAADGIRTSTVVGTDDLLSAPEDRARDRRGVAGLFFSYKTAGAAAERGDDLSEVTQIAQRTVDRTRTMGVGLTPTILPAAGEPTFTLDDSEMEIGIGIHGEPGKYRGELECADSIADRFVTAILGELALAEGDRVAVLVNGLGATPLEELYLLYRRVHHGLLERGIEIGWRFIGELVTSLEMAGASLSMLHLDDELEELMNAPAYSPFYSQGLATLDPKGPKVPVRNTAVDTSNPRPERQIRVVTDPGPLRAVALHVAGRMPSYADELRELDAALGDGDLGITISSGGRAIVDAIERLPWNAQPDELFSAMGAAFAAANPSTYSSLLGEGMLAAAGALDRVEQVTTESMIDALAAMQTKIMERGKAELGDKTVVDVFEAVRAAVTRSSGSAGSIASAAARAAEKAVDDGKALTSQRGRAGWIGERSKGHADPGSVALQRILEEIAAAIR